MPTFFLSLLAVIFSSPARAGETAIFDVLLGQTVCYLKSAEEIDNCLMAPVLQKETISVELVNDECEKDCALYTGRFEKAYTVSWAETGEETSAALEIAVVKYSARIRHDGRDSYTVFVNAGLPGGRRADTRRYQASVMDTSSLDGVGFETAPLLKQGEGGKLLEKYLTGSVENLRIEKR